MRALSALLLIGALGVSASAQTKPVTGPLRPLSSNSRYFTDGSGRAIYLTGAHTWNNLQDFSPVDKLFSYTEYLDFLAQHNHNFFRMWAFESPQGKQWAVNPASTVSPVPFARSGPGLARDLKPKFDLTQFNQEYFDRLRARVLVARDRGMYVAVMLFQGWDLEHEGWLPWTFHPFHPDNNSYGINGDPRKTGEGETVHTLEIPAITRIQEAYARKVIDTVNDLDNVLYEITNESGPYSTAWQYHMIDFIHKYEAGKAKLHPVGMTFQWSKEQNGRNLDLFNSPADWISPNADDGFGWDPPVADGRKVIVSDTDHLWGAGGSQLDNEQWVWKSFTRGLNTLFMDKYLGGICCLDSTTPPYTTVYPRLGQTRAYAEKINLAAMIPSNTLSSTRYCLANPGSEYLIYQPVGGTFWVDLLASSATFSVEWLEVSTGKTIAGEPVTGGNRTAFTPRFSGPAVLYLKALPGGRAKMPRKGRKEL